MFQYLFIQHALIGCVLASVLCAMVGSYIVTRRLVFISGGITHASFGGVGIGMLAGISPLLTAAVFAIASACGVQWMSRRSDVREDSAIAIFWTLGMSIGIICSFLTPGYTADLSSYLFGNILTITDDDLWMLGILTGGVLLGAMRWFAMIRAIAFDPVFSRAQGLPVTRVEYIMMMIIALTIVSCLRLVGIVLVMSLLTIPQATANIFCKRLAPMIVVSAVISIIDCIGGLYIAFVLGIPSGAAIIFTSIILYAICKLASRSSRLFVIVLSLTILTACSTKKNTALTRRYHAFTAKYNTTYNGELAFIEGLTAQEKGHRDNYTMLLPISISADKSTAGMGKSNYDTAIEKAEKAIKKHSIKVKPERKSNKRLTAKEKEYRARREFNPFLKRPWMMIADAQFNKGDFIEAASTYAYIIHLYQGQPDVVSVARAKMAMCYNNLEWPYDAEDILRTAARDSMTTRGLKEYTKSQAGLMVLTKQWSEAIPLLKKAIKFEKRSKQRPRLNYLLGQVAQLAGDNNTAYRAWGKVIKATPTYELAFNARLRQTEVIGATKSKAMLRRLRSMARNQNNKDYLDQVYHAMGRVYLATGDTLRAIEAMKQGIEKATQSGTAKAALMLHLGQLYWDRENYVDAAECYAGMMSVLDKKHEEYEESERRNNILKELAPPLADVRLQDSLLALSVAPEAERNAAIDRVIKELKRKEKEEAKKNGGQTSQGQNGNTQQANNNAQGTQGQSLRPNANKAEWYFYNPQVVQSGLETFRRRWQNRRLEDNWRRSNRQGDVRSEGGEDVVYNDDNNGIETAKDSLDTTADEERQRRADSLANDPHHREFYMKQIPFTDEQKAASHGLIAQGLFKGGLLEITPLENYPLAERTLKRLLDEYPEFESRPEVLYNMFLLYGRQGDTDMAATVRDSLINGYPDHALSVLLKNPRYERNARYGKHIEDSLYATAYNHFRSAEYGNIEPLYVIHNEDFPEGPHRGRFLFVRAMSALYGGQRDTFMVSMQQLIDKYSQDEIAAWSKDIMQGVKEGRLLNSDGAMVGDIWSRLPGGSDSDTTKTEADTLSTDRLTPFTFILAWPALSLDANHLLYEVARYNFSTFMARNFDIELLTENKDIHQLRITGFNSFEEVHTYVQQLAMDNHMHERLDGIRHIIIADCNLPLLGTKFSYAEYDDFYQHTFVPDRVPEDLKLDEPHVEIIDPENIDPAEQQNTENNDTPTTDDFEWPW